MSLSQLKLLCIYCVSLLGGGQPDDHGTIGNYAVENVQRNKENQVIHQVTCPDPATADSCTLTVGDTVTVKVDWSRRFDHMQQHSGQHLITAIFKREYDLDTLSWNLGKDRSYLDLSCKMLAVEKITRCENIINDAIRNAIDVNVVVADKDSECMATV